LTFQRIPVAAFAVPFALLPACADGTPAVPAPTVDTLANGTVVIDNAPVRHRIDSSPWTLTEDLRIGSVEGTGSAVFGEIYGFAVDSGGGIFVLDGQAQELRYFSKTGEFVRTLGRRGEGPGEFSNAAGLALNSKGQLAVWDGTLRRFTIFGGNGDLNGTFPRTATGFVYPWPGRFVNDQLVDVGLDFHGQGPGTIGTHTRFHYVRHNEDFTALDTIATIQYPLMAEGTVRRPFSPTLKMNLNADGSFWTTSTHEYRFHHFTADRDTIRVVSLPMETVPVTDHESDSLLSLMSHLAVTRDIIYHDKPLVQRLVADSAGTLLVFPVDRNQQGAIFDVFDPTGQYLGRVRSPAALDDMPAPQLIGSFLYGVTKDPLGVEYLVRLRVNRNTRHP
jgi:hypothetical protein